MKPKILRLAALLVCVLAAGLCASAQKLEWRIDFGTVFNNREGGDEMRPDGTFLFTRLSPEIGVSMPWNGGRSKHMVMGGVSWYQPLTDNMRGYKVTPTIYYEYEHAGKWSVVAGMMPRTKLVDRMPLYLWSDSMEYVNSNIKGLLVQYRHDKKSYGEFFVDWRQMQSERRREAFVAVVDGRRYFGKHWWAGGYVQYNHLAKRKNAPADEGVNDDFCVNPLVGYDCRWDGLKLGLEVKAGAVVNMERARVDKTWQTASGFVAAAKLRWKFLEAEENFYAGKDLYPLYDRFGSELNMGDTYFRDKVYGRTDLRAHIVQTSFVDLVASVSCHVTDKTTGFWQQVSCRFYIDGMSRGKGWRKRPLLHNNY